MKPRQRVLGPWDSRAPARRGRHGLSADEIEYLETLGCAGCGRPGPLAVDHDHHTCHPGPVGCRNCARGMLCPRCNNILRWLDDDVRVLRRLADYLDGTAAR